MGLLSPNAGYKGPKSGDFGVLKNFNKFFIKIFIFTASRPIGLLAVKWFSTILVGMGGRFDPAPVKIGHFRDFGTQNGLRAGIFDFQGQKFWVGRLWAKIGSKWSFRAFRTHFLGVNVGPNGSGDPKMTKKDIFGPNCLDLGCTAHRVAIWLKWAKLPRGAQCSLGRGNFGQNRIILAHFWRSGTI